MQLFGIAAIGTVLCHAHYFVKEMPESLQSILGYGNLGVYMFSLLSGMGLYFSLKSAEGIYNKRDFFKKRFKRLVVPYILIVGLWYIIKYFIISFKPLQFIYELSTLSFWVEHKGAWYVAMLFWIYAVYPWFYDWIESENRSKKTAISLLVVFVTGVLIFYIDNDLYKHVSNIWCSLIVFIIGHYIGKLVRENRYSGFRLFMISILLFSLKSAVSEIRDIGWIYNISFALLGVAATIGFTWILHIIKSYRLNSILAFLGKYSLEIYLSNLVWIQVFQFWNLNEYFDESGVISYLIIICLGMITSILFGNLSSNIISKCTKYKSTKIELCK